MFAVVETMQLFVTTITGKTIFLNVSPFDDVNEVKSKVRTKVGYAPDTYRLIYGEERLEDHEMLSDYNIKSEDTIHVAFLSAGKIRAIYYNCRQTY